MEYTIIETSTANELSSKVTEALQQGWALHGVLSVVVTPGINYKTYSQAMTRD